MKSLQRILSLLMITIFISACGNSSEPRTDGLSYDQVILATENVEKQEYTQHHDKAFKKGDKVIMIVTNVGEFEKGSDGFHVLDMSNQLKDPTGKVIFAEKGLLGENGRAILSENRAPQPSTFFNTDASLPTGEYTATLIIYDLVSGKQVKVNETFTLIE